MGRPFARGAFYVVRDGGQRVVTCDLQVAGWGEAVPGTLKLWLFQQDRPGPYPLLRILDATPTLDEAIVTPWSSILVTTDDGRVERRPAERSTRQVTRRVVDPVPASMRLALDGTGPVHLVMKFETEIGDFLARTELTFDAVTGDVASGGRFAVAWVDASKYGTLVPIGDKDDDEKAESRPTVGGKIGFRRGLRGKRELYVPKGESVTITSTEEAIDQVEFWVGEVYPPDGSIPSWAPCHSKVFSPAPSHTVEAFNNPSTAMVTNDDDVYAWLVVRVHGADSETSWYYKCGPFLVKDDEHELVLDETALVVVGDPIVFE